MTTGAGGVFPLSDHFPLGAPRGLTGTVPEPVSEVRPFGLLLARPPLLVASVDHSAIGYDADRQIAVVLDEASGCPVPLAAHTDGQTGTVTHGDGHGRNDSDTDHRED